MVVHYRNVTEGLWTTESLADHCDLLQCITVQAAHPPAECITHGSARTLSTSPIMRLIHKSAYSDPIAIYLALPAVCVPLNCRLQILVPAQNLTSYSCLATPPVRTAQFRTYRIVFRIHILGYLWVWGYFWGI